MSRTKKMITAAACIALCVVLPLAFHAIPKSGSLLSPMHIPVFLCGLVCGPVYGLICGLIGPFASSILTQMPAMGFLPVMMVELAVYGLVSGIMMKVIKTEKSVIKVYISLFSAMVIGRIFAGLAQSLVFSAGNYSLSMWISSYILGTLPAIVIHIILVPAVYFAIKRAGLVTDK